MAAPLGFKTFNSGDVLTAADTNGYLMQGVWTFANAAARTAAVTSPQEGNVSFLKDTNALEIYDGAAWVAYGSGDITGVTAGTGISGGGTSGTVTITNSMATEITAAGDIIVGTGSGTFDNLPIGTTGQVLTADTTVSPYKVKWASAAAGYVGCLLYRSTSQSINSGADTEILFANEHFDTDSFHSTSTNTGRITIPSGKDGKYLFVLHAGMTQGNQTGNYFYVKLTKNGNDVTQNVWYMQSSGTNPAGGFVYVVDAVANDYFQMYVLHNSTTAEDTLATTNYTTSFGCTFLGA